MRDEEVGGVGLGGEAGGHVVAIAHILTIVQKDHAGFERHGDVFRLDGYV